MTGSRRLSLRLSLRSSLFGRACRVFLSAVLLSLAFSDIAAAATAGTFDFVLGDVRVRAANGTVRAVKKGDIISEGERVITGSAANAQIRMVDSAYIAVRPSTELDVKTYQYSGRNDGKENAVLSLVNGTMRAFTGAISRVKKENFEMVTPTATIGIRGSGNVVHFSPNLGTLNHTIEGSHAVTGIGAAGQVLGTVITLPGQTVQVLQNQPPVRIPTPPFLIQAATSRPGPGPQTQGGGQGTGASRGSGGSAGSSSSEDTTVRSSAAPDAALGTATAPATSLPTTTVSTASSTPTTLTGTTSEGSVINTTTGTLTGSTGTTVPISAQPGVLGLNAIASFFYWPEPANSGPALVFGALGSNDSMRVEQAGDIDTAVFFDGANGNLSSAKRTRSFGDLESVTVSGTPSFASTVTTLANGISYGRYTGANVAVNNGSTLAVSDTQIHDGAPVNVLGGFQWITGPQPYPIFTSSVLTGTAFYTSFSASSPTDQNGITGIVDSAFLDVNFNTQSVSAALQITMPPNTAGGGTFPRIWYASGSNIAMDDGGGFQAFAGSTGALTHNNLLVSLTENSVTSQAFGEIHGQLTGQLLNGAVLGYAFAGTDPTSLTTPLHEHVNGVVGFSSPNFFAPSPYTPDLLGQYRIVLRARGSIAGFDANASIPAAGNGILASVPASSFDNEALVRVAITAVNPARLSFDGSGGVTQFDGNTLVVTGIASPGVCSSFGCNTNDSTSTRVSIVPGGTPASGDIPAMPAITIAGTTATGAAQVILDPGVAAVPGFDPTTGISWGRYDKGAFAIVDRVTGAVINTGVQIGNINHYLLSPIQSGPTTLPLTGTATYALVGGTSPTDHTGKLGNVISATLSADFSAKTVSGGVNISFPAAPSGGAAGTTWSASASNVPIIAGVGFEAARSPSGAGTLAMSCTGCPSTQLSGQIVGAFTGSAGQGAGVAYSLNSGGSPQLVPGAITVGGVGAFKKLP